MVQSAKTRTSPFTPWGNWQTERMNKGLVQMLKAMVEEHPNQWDQLLAKELIHYRSSVNASTGFTPYRLIFGRGMRLPIDAMLGDPPGMTPKLLPPYVADQRDQILTTEQMARDNLQMAQTH